MEQLTDTHVTHPKLKQEILDHINALQKDWLDLKVGYLPVNVHYGKIESLCAADPIDGMLTLMALAVTGQVGTEDLAEVMITKRHLRKRKPLKC
tara:strand:+ start:1981 stop:2262 length:282 start_codon:yes stop_codon:yes gene_type:complete